MTRAFHAALAVTFPDVPSSQRQQVSVDIVDELSAALGPKWDVLREIDYAGEESIIALPADDIDAMPTLIMYEEHGQTHVATIRGVEWETNHAFSSFRHAVSAMIATAAFLSNTGQAIDSK
jgi:hypothetical protein